jgi:putative phosphoesterase
MTRIGLLSDTHGHIDPGICAALENCDEIWHAGDWGPGVAARLSALKKPVRGVWGNIDGADIRVQFPETAIFSCEGVRVLMHHIGGYPGRYAPGVKAMLQKEKPALFIAGHSHILKVMPDPVLNILHMNPGAAGHHGWHAVRTLLRFSVDGDRMKDCEVVELGKRGRTSVIE